MRGEVVLGWHCGAVVVNVWLIKRRLGIGGCWLEDLDKIRVMGLLVLGLGLALGSFELCGLTVE